MQEYKISCPICSVTLSIEIPDAHTIYYIEGFEQSHRFTKLFNNEPDVEIGSKKMISRDWINIHNPSCPEDHKVNVYATHYEYIENASDRLHGPAEEPNIFCPECTARLDNHKNHIYRFDSSLDMQYVLRTVSQKDQENYKNVEAVTRTAITKYNQISTTKDCFYCGKRIHFNYSARSLDPSESYKGIV